MQRAILWYPDDSALDDSETSQDGTEKTKEANRRSRPLEDDFERPLNWAKTNSKNITDGVCDLDAETREVHSCRKTIRRKMLQRTHRLGDTTQKLRQLI